MKNLLVACLLFFLISGPVSGMQLYNLNYYDLVELSQTASPKGELLEKLNSQLNAPIIEQPLNEERPDDFLRIANWNIERGFNTELIEKIFERSFLTNNFNLIDELDIFSKASIIVLNETDIGIPRTKYENIPKRLAHFLKAGYIFGTEFIEVDPYQLGIKKFTDEEKVYLEEEALKQLENIQKEKYSGLHGTTILTKYPVLQARTIRLPECYMWYLKEKEKLTALEFVRRGAAEKIFAAKVLTELRHGGRIALVADLKLPNNDVITIVATHLENRCMPECRLKQLQFLLNEIKNIKNPVVLTGDFNTTGTDSSPTSIKKEILARVRNPEYIARQAIWTLTSVTFIQNFVLNSVNFFRQFKDPTTKHIPVVLPNKESNFFKLIREFKFEDGNGFDTEGEKGFLSSSNEREIKGFKTTFELPRTLGVAKYKLDWFFVKPQNQSYRPTNGRTLQLINRAFGGKISDHDPITVDVKAGD